MKTGLTTSVILHAAVLGFGLFSLSAPKAFDVSDVEALPVEIVSITQLQQGDKKATMSEKPAPTPTKKPDVVPDAQKVGENKVDTDKPATPEPTPKEVKTAAVPKPSPEPAPKPADQPKPEPVKQPEPKPVPVPATEVTPQPQPKQEVKPDPVAETIVAENAEAEAVKLPENAPSPEARPQPPKAETAKTPDRKDAEKPAEKQANRPKSEEKEFNADEVAALLNKEKASGGGAKRSTEQAALGSEKQSNSSKLSQSEMDALRGQIQRCWNPPVGLADASGLKISVKMKLSLAGELEADPDIVAGGGGAGIERIAAEAARRAVIRCAPYNLPSEKYDGGNGWNEVLVNFDPSEMF
jgi:outer membrane biosynthesis protein TonB